MAAMQQRLSQEPATAERYQRAHDLYLRGRAEHGEVAEIDGISAGGMPERVKCLHVPRRAGAGDGPGVNPFGDEALAELRARGFERSHACVEVP